MITDSAPTAKSIVDAEIRSFLRRGATAPTPIRGALS